MAKTLNASGITRRKFLTGAGVLAAGAGLAGLASCAQPAATDDDAPPEGDRPETGIPETQHFSGVCRGGCAGHCLLDIHVRDGVVVRTTAGEQADPRYNRICGRGSSHVARLYSEQRVKYPMRRVEGTKRGDGEFERITWDEAIDEICTKWKQYVEESGPQSIAYGLSSGNAGDASLFSLILMSNVLGMSSLNGNVDQAMSYAFPHVMGTSMFGTQNEQTDFVNSKTFVCWGASPTMSTPQTMHFILDAMEGGTRLVCIDIMSNAQSAKADWFLPVIPSTDGALAMGALNYLLEQGWEDVEFIRAHTEAPFFVKEDGTYLRLSDLGTEPVDTGEVNPYTGEPVMYDPYVVWDEETGAPADVAAAATPSLESRTDVGGVPVTLVYDLVKQAVSEYPLSVASEWTGVSEDDIKELARMYAQDGPVNTLCMIGLDHYRNGHYNYWPIYALSAFTGNIGKPGAACGVTMSEGSLLQNFMAFAAPTDAEGNFAQGASGIDIQKPWINDILDTKTYAGQPFELRSLYIALTNPFGTSSNRQDIMKWVQRLDFIVVSEIAMTETAMHADILLPACHWFEEDDVVSSGGSTPFYMRQEKVLEPQFESKPDMEIARLICEGMGYPGFIPESNDAFLENLFTSDALAAQGIDFERIKTEKSVKQMAEGSTFIAYEGGNFATATGRFSLYNEAPAPQYNVGQAIDLAKERTLYWEPATYVDPRSEARTGDYPFGLYSTHVRMRTHTQWFDVGYVNEFDPVPYVGICPDDAAEHGIAEDDVVRVYNAQGSVLLPAHINAGLPRGLLTTNVGFNGFEFIEGSTSDLTTNNFNQVCANLAFNDCAVAIEKA